MYKILQQYVKHYNIYTRQSMLIIVSHIPHQVLYCLVMSVYNYDVVRINKDSIESILGMLYILTQHLIKLYIYNING